MKAAWWPATTGRSVTVPPWASAVGSSCASPADGAGRHGPLRSEPHTLARLTPRGQARWSPGSCCRGLRRLGQRLPVMCAGSVPLAGLQRAPRGHRLALSLRSNVGFQQWLGTGTFSFPRRGREGGRESPARAPPSPELSLSCHISSSLSSAGMNAASPFL